MLAAADRERISASSNPDIRHYLHLNPGYGEKLGAFTLIPLDWRNSCSSLWLVLRRYWRRRWRVGR